MFWKYLIFSFLLAVPSSRIFTFASPSFEGPGVQDEQRLLDNIVRHLASGRSGDVPATKKDEPAQQSIIVQDSSNKVEPPAAPLAQEEQLTNDDIAKQSLNTENQQYAAQGKAAALQHQPQTGRDEETFDKSDTRFLILTIGAGCVCFVGLVAAGACYYKYRKSSKATSDVEYPAYGVTGPMKERIPSPGDRKLAQSAQMYHYQHQKQQMIAMEKANGDMKHDASDDDSEEDNVEGDYTVYECPGLAPTGEMEVKNPLFRGDETPVTPNPQEPDTQMHGQPGSPSGAEH